MTLIDQKSLDRVREDITNARGLPNSFYTDAEVFALEKRAVFGNNWACIGFAKDVPNPGDAKPIGGEGRRHFFEGDGAEEREGADKGVAFANALDSR